MGLVNREKLQQARRRKARKITIAIRGRPSDWIYEAVQGRPDEYSVFGTWLPVRDTYPDWRRSEKVTEKVAEAFIDSSADMYFGSFTPNAWLV